MGPTDHMEIRVFHIEAHKQDADRCGSYPHHCGKILLFSTCRRCFILFLCRLFPCQGQPYQSPQKPRGSQRQRHRAGIAVPDKLRSDGRKRQERKQKPQEQTTSLLQHFPVPRLFLPHPQQTAQDSDCADQQLPVIDKAAVSKYRVIGRRKTETDVPQNSSFRSVPANRSLPYSSGRKSRPW